MALDLLNFLSLNQEAFGLDISDLSFKIAKLKKRGRGFKLASLGEFSLEPEIISQGEIKNEKALTKAIKDSLGKVEGERLKTKNVVVSLPEEKAFLQVIQMPLMAEEELRSAVKFEAENYIPMPIEKVYLDFQIIKPVVGSLDHLDVLIAALPRKTVDPYFSALQKAGLKPVVFEIESQATARALIEKGRTPHRILIIDLGATRTRFIVFAGFSIRFTSSIPVCGDVFDKAIAKGLKVSAEEAERLKVEYGIAKFEQKNKDFNDGKNSKGEKVFEILVPPLTDLLEQIKKCLSYYHSHHGHEHLPKNEKKVGKILLCGGGGNLKGICDFLSQELGMPVEFGNPWINVSFSSSEPSLASRRPSSIPPKNLKMSSKESLKYTTVLGLALRGAGL